MPTYQYVCTDCGEQLEVVQKFTDDALTVHEADGGRLRKVFSPVGIVFKGSGFYRTDSRKGAVTSSSGSSDSSSSSSSSEAGEKKSEKSDKSEKSTAAASGDKSSSSSSSSSASPAKSSGSSSEKVA